MTSHMTHVLRQYAFAMRGGSEEPCGDCQHTWREHYQGPTSRMPCNVCSCKQFVSTYRQTGRRDLAAVGWKLTFPQLADSKAAR